MDGEGGEWRRRWMEKEVNEEGGEKLFSVEIGSICI